ncbi:exosortase E/protease, VPEID-CTERM system [Bythopirellula goksoeyrii]|uniref:Transmembrane exosortase (Exosortase_EpsH) n=1 Tax=Bythopirellula goksoeyrii TaxID=1400387 RepID=A0A5B9QAB3_9BACT|nr:exosortase E/protease, VPEID-CTERM system [Bythopirellula goksoeyrii]QEG36004.1 Transmembrane exosortase (Exosortase_EpsH) [Bythopirellula goksoeyrii]
MTDRRKIACWLFFAALILIVELVGLTFFYEAMSLQHGGSLAAILLSRSERIVSLFLTAAAILCVAMFPKLQAVEEFAFEHVRSPGSRWGFLALHFLLFTLFVATSNSIYQSGTDPDGARLHMGSALSFFGIGLATYVALALAALPWSVWQKLFRLGRLEIILSLLAGVACLKVGKVTMSAWDRLSEWTFHVVEWLLLLVYPEVVSVHAEKLIGTPAFSEVIAPECSGYQGIGMILVFFTFFLWHFRSRLRFPAALLLLPMGCVAIWLANCLRIALLIIVGDKISPAVAVEGFHSQTGWFFFCVVALGLAVLALNSRWCAKAQEPTSDDELRSPTLLYLLPFLALMAGMILTGMASTDFDWLYPVRIAVAGAALLFFFQEYRKLDWSWSWAAPLTGVAVYIIWILMEQSELSSGAHLKSEVDSLSSTWKGVWLVSRVIGSVIIIPVAEELAFRGYLLRRLVSPDFAHVSRKQMHWPALAISSLLFGLMHQRWLAGTVAGVIYGLLYRHRGNLTDPIVAHSVTNGLIAVHVLLGGSWYLWT